MTETERATDVDQPEGGAPSRESDGSGTTPHPDQPAEGEEREGGADTPDV
ncbi:hypothetical protein [Blastococcus goldschmidtiae]|uniref:Uncharacterized protein n=1 Tax=Blastococcus goldschmidtiae TaxID=3075546 RepID=A0ABU2K3A1_9ACTN|nr:hypothetical protein [Blastococcus sp. DSM 46792]MDT0274662.1 hypothetical protein [Blastococcus sp. DSM 46792]